MASDITAPSKNREKVHLKPGRHLVDWVRLNNGITPSNNSTRKITAAELLLHNTKLDCWTAYDGKVYDITNYLEYHPGGEKIMLGAGIDCTQLYNKYHRWVNGHAMLSNCCVGQYVGNDEAKEQQSTVSKFSQVSSDGISLNEDVLHQAINQLELSDDEDHKK